MDNEIEEQIKRLRNLIFGIGLLAIVGGNTSGLFTLLYPDSVQSIAKDVIVTKKHLKEILENNDQLTLFKVEHLIETEVDLALKHSTALFNECRSDLKENTRSMELIKLTLERHKVLIGSCLDKLP